LFRDEFMYSRPGPYRDREKFVTWIAGEVVFLPESLILVVDEIALVRAHEEAS
jgi:hypothetical protein